MPDLNTVLSKHRPQVENLVIYCDAILYIAILAPLQASLAKFAETVRFIDTSTAAQLMRPATPRPELPPNNQLTTCTLIFAGNTTPHPMSRHLKLQLAS